MKIRNSLMMAGALVLVVSVLAGCRANEQGRVLSFQKGTYLGKSEAPLSDSTLRALRARASNQSGPVELAFSSRGGAGASILDTEALRKRSAGQNDNN